MPILSATDYKNDLTIFTADGNPSFEEFMTAVKVFYDGTPTSKVLWSLSQATVWDLSGQHIQKLANYTPRIDKSRVNAKTAFVASDKLSNSLTELFVLLGQSIELNIQIKIFQSFDEALTWLNIEP